MVEDYTWVWCVHCMRCYRPGTGGWCPYKDCDGSELDAWPWARLVGVFGYPAVPEVGKVYTNY
jgi:hypothetical protein